MKTPFVICKNNVSKRDTHPKLKWNTSLIVFIGLFAMTIFSLSAKAGDLSKTEADGVCVDCVVASLTQQSNTNDQFKDFKAINVAIFSATPGGSQFVDPRSIVDRNENKQLNAIGLITVSGTLTAPVISDPHKSMDFKTGAKAVGTGTGFLINDCLVITNQHVTSLENHSQYAKDLKITFSAGAPTADGKEKFLLQSSGTVVATGGYSGKDSDVNNDWSIIKLEKPLGETVGSITPILDGSIDQISKIPVSSASFYLDKSDGSQLWGQKSCSIFPAGDSIVKTDCPSIPGASGSPVFAQNPQTKQVYALGIIEGGKTSEKLKDPVNAQNANNMVLFSKALTKERLKDIIAKNQCGISI